MRGLQDIIIAGSLCKNDYRDTRVGASKVDQLIKEQHTKLLYMLSESRPSQAMLNQIQIQLVVMSSACVITVGHSEIQTK